MILLVIFLIITFVIFLIYLIPIGPISDSYIIQQTAKQYDLSKHEIATESLVTQLLSSTLAQPRDVPTGIFINVIDTPSTYNIANIYTISQITDITKSSQTPTVLNEPFEIFLAAVSMAQDRSLPFFYLFSLYSFGEEKFLAFSDQPIPGGYTNVSIYPWTSLEYADLLSKIGPAVKRGYYNPDNFD